MDMLGFYLRLLKIFIDSLGKNINKLKMNITLIFDSNRYKFDVQPMKTVEYLLDLSSKMFNLKKEDFDLLYNKQVVSKYAPTIPLQNILTQSNKEHDIHVHLTSVESSATSVTTPNRQNKINSTKYINEINKLKEQFNTFDSSYQSFQKELNGFKIKLEESVQNLINVLKIFQEKAIIIDLLLKNNKYFEDLTLIKSDIMNFSVDSDDNINLKKIEIFTQKLQFYQDKKKILEKRKQYQSFILELINSKIFFFKDLYQRFDVIHKKNSNKNTYQAEIDNLILKYSQKTNIIGSLLGTMKKKDIPINVSDNVALESNNRNMGCHKGIKEKQINFTEQPSRNLSPVPPLPQWYQKKSENDLIYENVENKPETTRLKNKSDHVRCKITHKSPINNYYLKNGVPIKQEEKAKEKKDNFNFLITKMNQNKKFPLNYRKQITTTVSTGDMLQETNNIENEKKYIKACLPRINNITEIADNDQKPNSDNKKLVLGSPVKSVHNSHRPSKSLIISANKFRKKSVKGLENKYDFIL